MAGAGPPLYRASVSGADPYPHPYGECEVDGESRQRWDL
jgi:hypothetical protein